MIDKRWIGHEYPPSVLPIERTRLQVFAKVIGETGPIYADVAAARDAGMPDVFAHGMLGMAWLGRLLTNGVPQSQLRRFDVRFQGITHLGNAIRCTGRVVQKLDATRCVRVEVQTRNHYGQLEIVGDALVALPDRKSVV